jgi:hypothetical protein
MRTVTGPPGIAPIQFDRVAIPPAGRGVLEGRGVAPDVAGVDTDLVVAPAQHNGVAQLMAQEIEGAIEGGAGPLGVVLRPEEGEDGIPPVESMRAGGGQVHQEGEAPGLGQHGTELGPLGVPQVECAKGLESNHSTSNQRCSSTPSMVHL